jgi:hypothetical protein
LFLLRLGAGLRSTDSLSSDRRAALAGRIPRNGFPGKKRAFGPSERLKPRHGCCGAKAREATPTNMSQEALGDGRNAWSWSELWSCGRRGEDRQRGPGRKGIPP